MTKICYKPVHSIHKLLVFIKGNTTIGGVALCSNIDECLQNPCESGNPDQFCEDTDGNFLCKCDSGFAGLDSEGSPAECTNINECEANPSICGNSLIQKCTDLFGGFECSCAEGWDQK